ncbi:hypothetical protein ACFQWF_29195 [Methylorubrum suomiense]
MDKAEMPPTLRRHQFEHDRRLAVPAQAQHEALVDPLHEEKIGIFSRLGMVCVVIPGPRSGNRDPSVTGVGRSMSQPVVDHGSLAAPGMAADGLHRQGCFPS